MVVFMDMRGIVYTKVVFVQKKFCVCICIYGRGGVYTDVTRVAICIYNQEFVYTG